MPSFKTAGKTKKDLAVVAQLAGLLTTEQTDKMTRAQLISVLQDADENGPEEAEKNAPVKKPEAQTDAGKPSEDAPAKAAAAAKKPARKKTTTRKKAASADDAATGDAKASTTAKKKTTTRRKRQASKEADEGSDKNVPAANAKAKERPDAAKDDTSGSMKKPAAKKATAKKATSKKSTPRKGAAKNSRQGKAQGNLPKQDATKAEKASKEGEGDKQGAQVIKFKPKEDPAQKQSQPGSSEVEGEKKDESEAKPTEESKKNGSPNEKTRRNQVEAGELQTGVLEIMPDGYGFLRRDNYLQGSKDIYVPPQYIRRFNLRPGDHVIGPVKTQRDSDRYRALLYIKEVNGHPPEKMQRRPRFDRLTPIYPDERFVLESSRNELSTRIIDLVAPIGKGQRGMIVSPPKAGKTILLQKIANAISQNNPESKLIVLLIDERPEEVTDMQRSIDGEVVYSTFDKTPENHTKVVELVLERAMRLVELGEDVVILLDSMTRLARAYNLTINPTGRTLSGGLDPGALYGPKRFFGAARNIENGGSLTIIATSLIETGSRMDEVIFEEFKGTGNMEVYLDRKLSEKRIFPAIDINKSGTRREELLLSNKELDSVWTIRKAFSQLDTAAVTEAIINLLLKTQNNEHFISSVNVSFNDKNVFESMRGNRPGHQGNGGKSNGYGNNL